MSSRGDKDYNDCGTSFNDKKRKFEKAEKIAKPSLSHKNTSCKTEGQDNLSRKEIGARLKFITTMYTCKYVA